MTKPQIALAVTATLLVLIVGWRMLPGGPSRAALMDEALHAEDSAQRQAAALSLLALDKQPYRMADLFAESDDPAIRAICIQGMGDAGNFDAVDTLLTSLDDPDPLVRSSAAGSLGRLMRCRTNFLTAGSEEDRRQAVVEIRARWGTLVRYGLLEELAEATSLSYFYNQHTGELFEAPSQMPDAFELPAGPFQGMPAAVRASVFSKGDCRDSSQRFVGWLSVHDEILREHGAPLPAAPAENSDSMLIRRPDDTAWVYASSDEGQKIPAAIYKVSGNSPVFARPCLPGK